MTTSNSDLWMFNAILQARAIGYLRTNPDLTVHSTGGILPPYLGDIQTGDSLLYVFPELIGSEDILNALLAGERSRYTVHMINREDQNGKIGYFDLTLVSSAGKQAAQSTEGQEKRRFPLVAIWEDITSAGQVGQKLTQHRNDLTLLRNELAKQYSLLESTNHELRRTNQLKSKFVGVAAHELRSPLTSMLGYMELLQDDSFGPLTDQQQRFAATIDHSAHRLLSLLNNLMDITRLEVDNMDLNLEPTDLVQVIRHSEAEIRIQIDAKKQHLRIETEADRIIVLCDTARVQQIISNLLSNAGKYTPEGGDIRVTLSADPAFGYATVAVQDNGIGIAPDEIEHLFVSFFRASNASQLNATGAGLGLSIAASLTELHGGTMQVESELGHGSTFSFTLPLLDVQPADSAQALAAQTQPANYLG
ncbi:MAG: HAMP domain-containing histidine kinase [Caldilineaceae bacterium]|nr:HAMP domain-containing histidine kinase [Caldilineaceae bacterium]